MQWLLSQTTILVDGAKKCMTLSEEVHDLDPKSTRTWCGKVTPRVLSLDFATSLFRDSFGCYMLFGTDWNFTGASGPRPHIKINVNRYVCMSFSDSYQGDASDELVERP